MYTYIARTLHKRIWRARSLHKLRVWTSAGLTHAYSEILRGGGVPKSVGDLQETLT